MALAIFDLDETLISADSDHEWGNYVVERGLVDAASHTASNNAFYEDYKRGELDITAYLDFACSILTRFPRDELESILAEFVKERIEPLVLPRAVELIREHEARENKVLIVTSTSAFVTGPIARLLGIDTLIAPEPEVDQDGEYTGHIAGVPSFGPGKVTRLEAWRISQGLSLAGSYFYSDSHNDIPLLSHVENPVAVDPDDKLLAVAEERGWPVISLR